MSARGGDNITRGFYIGGYQGKTLDTVTLAYSTSVTGARTIQIVARLSTYNGAILGTAVATELLVDGKMKVTSRSGTCPSPRARRSPSRTRCSRATAR